MINRAKKFTYYFARHFAVRVCHIGIGLTAKQVALGGVDDPNKTHFVAVGHSGVSIVCVLKKLIHQTGAWVTEISTLLRVNYSDLNVANWKLGHNKIDVSVGKNVQLHLTVSLC